MLQKNKSKKDGCWRSSTGVSPLRRSAEALPIACDAFNARTVAAREYHCAFCASLPASCHACFTVRVVVARPVLPDRRLGAPVARLGAKGMCPLCCYDAAAVILRAFLSRCFQPEQAERGNAAPVSGSIYPKGEYLGNELGFQPAAQFFIHTQMGVAAFVVQFPQR